MATAPPKAVQDVWRAWVAQKLGGSPAQMEAATEAALAAVAARSPQEAVVRAAEAAWRGEPMHGHPREGAFPPTRRAAPIRTWQRRASVAPPAGAPSRVGRRGYVRGRVAAFMPRSEQRGRRYVTVWSFRVEQGNGLPPVALEMRGYAFEGSISNGDEVEVRAASGRHRVQRVSRLEDLSSNSTVRVSKKAAPILVGVLDLLTVIALIVTAANIVLPAAELPPWMPGYTQGSGSLHDTSMVVLFLVVGLGVFVLSRIVKRFWP